MTFRFSITLNGDMHGYYYRILKNSLTSFREHKIIQKTFQPKYVTENIYSLLGKNILLYTTVDTMQLKIFSKIDFFKYIRERF